MDNTITVTSDDLSNINLFLQFKGLSPMKAVAYEVTKKNELVLYWHHDERKTTLLPHPLVGVEIEHLIKGHLNLHEPTSKEMDGDGSSYKGYLLTNDPWGKQYNHLDSFYVTLICRPIWIYYGK